MSVPYIHTFYTPKGYYFYDFNTNAIVRINKSVYDFLNEWEKNKDCPNSQSECGNIIDELKRAGFLSERHWTKIEHPATKMLDRYLHSSVESITLQVTQQCNLKCNYCPYSGSYYNREHSNRHISFETAKQAIDFYIAHSFDIPVAHIGFYGGEPLIEYDLIRKIVEYCREKCFGKKIMYFMTTNATLLTEEVIDFLMENEFNLSISLDGPRNYHDRNRHRIDDSGSFDIVMQNIERLYKRYPEKKDNVQFNCVLDPTSDIKCINDFFMNEDMLKEYRVLFNSLSREGIKDNDKFVPNKDYLEQFEYELFKMFYSKSEKIEGIDVSKVVESYYLQIKTVYAQRKMSSFVEDFSHPGGPCIPGTHKLFVNVKGDFYPCEKVCECSADTIIGNIDKGFDLDKAETLLNVGKLTEEQCRDCWCAKYCYICTAHLDQGDGLSRELKQKHCAGVRKSIENDFKDYCLLHEMSGLDDDVIYLN